MSGVRSFLSERLPPAFYLPLGALYAAGNVAVAAGAGGPGGVARPEPWRFALAIGVVCLFVFRARLLDELERTLERRREPRALRSRADLDDPAVVRDLALAVVATLVLELAAVGVHGAAVLAAHVVAIAWTFVATDVFLGRFLRGALVTGALVRTFAFVLLGHSVAAQALGRGLLELPQDVLAFGLVNWALLAALVHARRTFAQEEEDPDIISISALHRPTGAALLIVTEVVVALLVLAHLVQSGLLTRADWLWHLGLGAACALAALVYAISPTRRPAQAFRLVATGLAPLVYGSLAYQLPG